MKKFILVIIAILTFVTLISKAEEGVEHKNHIAVLMGATNGFYDEGKVRFTIGADYTHRFLATKPNLGLGFFAEVVTGEEVETIIGIPLSIFITNKLKFFAAPSYIIIPKKS